MENVASVFDYARMILSIGLPLITPNGRLLRSFCLANKWLHRVDTLVPLVNTVILVQLSSE